MAGGRGKLFGKRTRGAFRCAAGPVILILSLARACAQHAPAADAPSEEGLAALTKPARKLPFKKVIHATTRHQVIDLNTNNPAHADLQTRLQLAATLAGERARKEGIAAARANEAGNQIEKFVRDALREV